MDALRDDVPSDAENALGVTAFMLAAGHGYKDIVRCLAAEDSYGTSGAHRALQRDSRYNCACGNLWLREGCENACPPSGEASAAIFRMLWHNVVTRHTT